MCVYGQLLSCVWLFVTPMDCNLPGCSVHRIFQTGILEWVAISYFRATLLVCGCFFDPSRIGQPLILWQLSKQVRFRNE